MGKHQPIEPEKLNVGDTVEWVEDPDVWDVEVLDIKDYGIIVDAGYGKTALFAPSSEGDGRYIRLIGTMEMDDYLRHPKKKNKKQMQDDKPKSEKVKKKAKKSKTVIEDSQPVEPEKFQVGEMVEWVEEDGTIWDVEVLEVRNYGVVVSQSWDKALFAPSAKKEGQHTRWVNGVETGDYIRQPKKTVKKSKKK